MLTPLQILRVTQVYPRLNAAQRRGGLRNVTPFRTCSTHGNRAAAQPDEADSQRAAER